MNVAESLKSLSGYPISQTFLEQTAVKRGLSLETEATADVLESKEYDLMTADTYEWLSLALTISQGGISFQITETARESYKTKAQSIFMKYRESVNDVRFGYKGTRL